MTDRIPLLRILLPFVVGILLADVASVPILPLVGLIVASTVAFFITHKAVSGTPVASIRLAFIPTSLLFIVSMLVGHLSAVSSMPRLFYTPDCDGRVFCGRITRITDRDAATELIAELTDDSHLPQGASGSSVILYLDHRNPDITEGDIMAFRSQLSRIVNLGNPEEFDYAKFMMRRGILYSQTLGEECYRIIGHKEDLHTASRHFQRKLINLILDSPLSPEAKRLTGTAILGDASLIDNAVRASFSKAGMAHILAISGLHIGIILALITMLLRPLDYLRLRHLRIAVSLAAILLFLFITGMSVSAVRATIMAGFVMIALLTHRDSISLNSICAASLLILSISPEALYDAGFQLSFTAVTSIVLFSRHINRISPRSRILFTLMAYVAATISANIGCALISAYHFHTLPLLSVLSNIIVIPILPLFAAIGIIYIAMLSLGVNLPELQLALDGITSLMQWIAEASTAIPGSHIDNIHVTTAELILYYTTVALVLAAVLRRSFTYMLCAIASTAGIATASIIQYSATPRESVAILNSGNSTPILHFDNGSCHIRCDDNIVAPAEIEERHKGLMAKYGVNSVDIVSNKDNADVLRSSLDALCGRRFAIISSTKVRHLCASPRISIDYLVVTSRYYGNLSDLMRTFAPKMIIVSGAIHDERLRKLLGERDSLAPDIRLHVLSTDGAVMIPAP